MMIMEELTRTRISVAIHAVVAILTGWVCVQVAAMSRTLFAGILGLVILIIIGYVTEQVIGKKGIKWWLSNGVIIYILVWLVSWVYFFNAVLV